MAALSASSDEPTLIHQTLPSSSPSSGHPSSGPHHTSDPPTSRTSTIQDASELGAQQQDCIPQRKQRAMLATLEAIFQCAEEGEGGVGVSELQSWSIDDEGYEDLSGWSKTRALARVKDILHQMWSTDSQFLTRAAEVLADGSRHREVLQSLYKENGPDLTPSSRMETSIWRSRNT